MEVRVVIPVLLTFIAVFLLFGSIFLTVSTIKESPAFALKMRLRRLAATRGDQYIPDDLRSEILKEIPAYERMLTSVTLFRKLDRMLDQAGLKIQLHIFLLYAITATVVPAIGFYIFYHKALFALIVAPVIFLIIIMTLRIMKVRREEKLTEQLPDLLMMFARSLRAGHSLTSAVELVGLETANPAGELFKTAYEQQKLGMRITDTLASMTDRIESLDLRFFITAISINSEIGGNLAEILDKLAETIRERLKVRRQVRVFTAQGRMSGYVLGALPIFMFIMFYVVNPAYEMLLIKEKTGNYLLIFAVVMQILGYLVIRKIINIRI